MTSMPPAALRAPALATIILLLGCAGASAPLESASGASLPASSVAMRPFGTQPAVEVWVNGRGPYLFLVDTGASGVARIDSSVATELQLPVVGRTTATGATGGAPVAINRVAVRSLRLVIRSIGI
jgi:hypothetical protein